MKLDFPRPEASRQARHTQLRAPPPHTHTQENIPNPFALRSNNSNQISPPDLPPQTAAFALAPVAAAINRRVPPPSAATSPQPDPASPPPLHDIPRKTSLSSTSLLPLIAPMTTSPSDGFITGKGAGWRAGYLAGVMAEWRRAGCGAGGFNAPGGVVQVETLKPVLFFAPCYFGL